MAINWETFKNNMTVYLTANIAPSSLDFARFFLTQFDLSLKTATNYFQQPLGVTKLLAAQGYISTSLSLNTANSNSDKTFGIISKSISMMLLTTILIPGIPIPPTILPNLIVPNQILIPGNVSGLAKDLKTALGANPEIKNPKLATKLLVLALQKYLLTVGGLYYGLIFAGLAIIPAPPIPWLGVI